MFLPPGLSVQILTKPGGVTSWLPLSPSPGVFIDLDHLSFPGRLQYPRQSALRLLHDDAVSRTFLAVPSRERGFIPSLFTSYALSFMATANPLSSSGLLPTCFSGTSSDTFFFRGHWLWGSFRNSAPPCHLLPGPRSNSFIPGLVPTSPGFRLPSMWEKSELLPEF